MSEIRLNHFICTSGRDATRAAQPLRHIAFNSAQTTPIIVILLLWKMATRSSHGPTGPGGLRHPSKYSHPPPWQEQHEGSNICSSTKDFFCSTLRLRVLGYVIQQPPSFLFVISLLILTSVIPFIAVYIENAPQLPDTDEMKV